MSRSVGSWRCAAADSAGRPCRCDGAHANEWTPKYAAGVASDADDEDDGEAELGVPTSYGADGVAVAGIAL